MLNLRVIEKFKKFLFCNAYPTPPLPTPPQKKGAFRLFRVNVFIFVIDCFLIPLNLLKLYLLKRFLSSTIWFGYNHCQSSSKNEIDVEYYKKLDFYFCVYLLFTEIYVPLCKSKPQIFL